MSGMDDWQARINEQMFVPAPDSIAELQQRNAKLVAALRRIDAINDNPAIFSKDIDDVCTEALANQQSTEKP